MRAVTELFNGGLVTARVGALLESGELQRADDCIYREKDPAIWRAPGRTVLTSTAIGTDIRGVKHLSFDGVFAEQLILLGRRTDGSPTWTSGENLTSPAEHLYAAPFTGTSGLTPVEVGGQGRWTGTVTGTAYDANLVIASCTITGTAVTSSAAFGRVAVGMVVSGTGVTAGTRVSAVQDNSNLTLDTSATNGTVTLTFTQYPFLATAIGARVIGTGIGSNIYVTAVSNQDGTTGHYRTATLSAAPSGGNGVYQAVFTFGTAANFSNNGNEILDAIQFNARRYFVWDGSSGLRALDWVDNSSVAATAPTLGLRPVGLRPVVSAPTLTLNTGQSTGWNLVKGAGTYWFLITEIYSPNADIATALKDPVQSLQIVESAYLGTDPNSTDSQGGAGLPVSKAIVTPATDTITVTFPTVVNNGDDGYVATHWGIYIYGPAADRPSLALMRRAATVPMTTYASGQTYVLTEVALTQTGFAGGFRAATGYALPFSHVDHMTGGYDSEYGSTQTGGSHAPVYLDGASGLTTYGLSTSGDYASKIPIGVEVRVYSRARPLVAGCWLKLMTTGGSKSTSVFTRPVTNHTVGGVVFGGPMDTLGVSWSTSDPGSFEVELGIQFLPAGGIAFILDVYAVSIKVYYTSVNVDFNGPAYRVVTYRDQVGATVSDPARLLPPACSTGDFFQGCLVVNDLATPNTIRYSLPDDPEAFPKPYRLTFNTRKRDIITYVRAFNGVLLVGMANSVKRVNYLPRETDTDMTSGLAHEDIAVDHGIPGPFCAAMFDMPGRGVFLAYASTSGMFVSNAQWTLPLNLDLDWENTVKLSALSTAVLRNYPRQKLLALYYCPAGATHSRNTRVMYFSYQADKLKGAFQMPAIGPSVVSARSACEAYLNGTAYLITGQEADGLLYLEDSGTVIPTTYQVTLTGTASTQGDGIAASGVDVRIAPVIRTRLIYSSGMDRDVFGDKIYLMFSPYGTTSMVSTCQLTAGSAVVTQASAGFVTAYAGWRVKGTGIDPGTIVLSVDNTGQITLSRPVNTTRSSTLTFDTGALGLTIRGSGLGEAVQRLSTDYVSTLGGSLVSVVNANIRRGFELQIEKVPLTFSATDTLTWSDFGANGTAMRLHQITYMVDEKGYPDTNRNTT